MKNVMKSTMAVLAIAVVTGCASGPSREDILEEQLRLAEMRAEALEHQKELKEAVLEEKLDDVPGWYLDAPNPDVTGLYGVGMASSTDLSVALKKARLTADFEVAQQMKQELSGLEQQFTADSNGMARNQYQSAVERFVAAVPMMGQEVAEQEVSIIDGKYTAYVLTRLSFDQMDRMAERQNKQAEGTTEMKEAFTMLRERVEATRTQSSGGSSSKPAETGKQGAQSAGESKEKTVSQIDVRDMETFMPAE